MDKYLINAHFITALISNQRTNTYLEKFSTINTLVNDKTITEVLCNIQRAIRLSSVTPTQNYRELLAKCNEHNISKKSALRILTLVIIKMLAHPDIDYSIRPNMSSLTLIMFQGLPRTENETLDQILTRHKLNPDFLLSCNSIKRLLYDINLDNRRICIYLKHGALAFRASKSGAPNLD